MMVIDSLSYLEHTPTTRPVTLLGVPLDVGKDTAGMDQGPQWLRAEGLTEMFNHLGVKWSDQGDIPCPGRRELTPGDPRVRYAAAIADVAATVASVVKEEVAQNHLVVALGGDHSISLGTVTGAALATPGELGLIYIDAHPDANTPETSLSGNVHGMVTTALLGFGHPDLVNIGGPSPKLQPAQVLFIGLKDCDQPEIDFLRRHQLSVFSSLDLERFGLEPVCQAIAALAKRVKRIWLSFDLDSVDRRFAPATPLSSLGGLTYREVYTLTKFIGKTCPLAGFDIVECLPAADQEDRTAGLAVMSAANLLGAEYSWYTAYMARESKKLTARLAGQAVDNGA